LKESQVLNFFLKRLFQTILEIFQVSFEVSPVVFMSASKLILEIFELRSINDLKIMI